VLKPEVSRRTLCSWFLLGTACTFGDPGWHYEAVDATPIQESGLRYDTAGPAGLHLRVYASAFTGSLDTEVDAVGSVHPLPDTTRLLLTVLDNSGRPLPPHRRMPAVSVCRTGGRAEGRFPTDAVVCSASATFTIRPTSGCSRNPDLDRVTLVVEGLGPGYPPNVKIPLAAH
jgi:hypothetical protein